jgi:hypothetical protein
MRSADGTNQLQCPKLKYWCTAPTQADPSPTAPATRLVEPERTSPTANSPGWLVSKGSQT